MTPREAAIVTMYTGYFIGQFSDAHAYAEELMGRPVWTHELPDLRDEIARRAKADFVNIDVKQEASA